MKRFLIAIALCLASSAYADETGYQNEALKQSYNTAGTRGPIAMNKYGQAMCSINAGTASATNPIKLDGAIAADSDAGMLTIGRVNTTGNTLASNGQYTTPSLDTLGQNFVAYNHSFQPVAAQAITKAEDSVHGSGDAGVFSLGVANLDLGGALCSGNGDYCPIATDINGAIYTRQSVWNNVSSPFRSEDVASSSGDAGVVILTHARTALTPLVGSSGDYSHVVSDDLGRLITTLAPAGETWQSCSSANTGTTDVAIKTAVASNRIYVSSITCTNTAAVASTIGIRDNTTLMVLGGISSSTLQGVATWNQTFPVPLRGSVNTQLNFIMGTTATNTTCCASGYISVN